mgnify:CR=1 FL=1
MCGWKEVERCKQVELPAEELECFLRGGVKLVWSFKAVSRHLVELRKLIEVPWMVSSWKGPTNICLQISMASLFLGWSTIACLLHQSATKQRALLAATMAASQYLGHTYISIAASSVVGVESGRLLG